ncbi:hypothetical protein Pelo_10318 [Pelomyxa schiedti]|nr:hypothetical protein Pelo_10318 [Pelomyxa schiedti]
MTGIPPPRAASPGVGIASGAPRPHVAAPQPPTTSSPLSSSVLRGIGVAPPPPNTYKGDHIVDPYAAPVQSVSSANPYESSAFDQPIFEARPPVSRSPLITSITTIITQPPPPQFSTASPPSKGSGFDETELSTALIAQRLLSHPDPLDDDIDTLIQSQICVVGSSTSNLANFFSSYIGMGCINEVQTNCFRKKIVSESFTQSYALDFCCCTEDLFGVNDYLFRVSKGFILVWNVDSRDSFDATHEYYQSILKIKGTDTVPMLLLMNHNFQSEDSWKVSKSEGEALAEMFKCPLIDIAATAKLDAALLSMCQEAYYIDQKLSEPRFIAETARKNETGQSVLEIVLLGDAFVGKTTFLNKFHSRTFSEQYISTDSKVVQERVLEVERPRSAKENFLVRLIDTPGFFTEQAISLDPACSGLSASKSVAQAAAEKAMEWLKQQSLMNCHGFVLLFNSTDKASFKFAEEVRKAIQAVRADFKGIQPVALVGTKIDMISKRVIYDKDGQDLAAKYESSYTPVNLAQPQSLKAIEGILTEMVIRMSGGGAPTTPSTPHVQASPASDRRVPPPPSPLTTSTSGDKKKGIFGKGDKKKSDKKKKNP